MKRSTAAVRSCNDSHSLSNKPIHDHSPKDADTEVLAGFLLSLKHRSVTPEPTWNDSKNEAAVVESSSLGSERNHHQYEPSSYESRSSAASSSSSSDDSSNQNRTDDSDTHPPPHDSLTPSTPITDIESLIVDSKLVCMEDRGLVPDPLFAAMAQMKPCRLQHADRVGCYKNRELGFVGMSCKWCGGQPGFGRYYPNSVRSLAQTTTSQTILKHIGSKCRFCPPKVRDAILELQQVQAAQEGLPTGRPRYGSRKIFFQRVWQRLHNNREEQEQADEGDEKTSISLESSISEEGSMESPPTSEDDDEGRSSSSSSSREEEGGLTTTTTGGVKRRRKEDSATASTGSTDCIMYGSPKKRKRFKLHDSSDSCMVSSAA